MFFFFVCNGVRNMEVWSSLGQSVVCFECKYCTAAVSSFGGITNLSNGVSNIIRGLISGFHRAFLKSITFIGRLMH